MPQNILPMASTGPAAASTGSDMQVFAGPDETTPVFQELVAKEGEVAAGKKITGGKTAAPKTGKDRPTNELTDPKSAVSGEFPVELSIMLDHVMHGAPTVHGAVQAVVSASLSLDPEIAKGAGGVNVPPPTIGSTAPVMPGLAAPGSGAPGSRAPVSGVPGPASAAPVLLEGAGRSGKAHMAPAVDLLVGADAKTPVPGIGTDEKPAAAANAPLSALKAFPGQGAFAAPGAFMLNGAAANAGSRTDGMASVAGGAAGVKTRVVGAAAKFPALVAMLKTRISDTAVAGSTVTSGATQLSANIETALSGLASQQDSAAPIAERNLAMAGAARADGASGRMQAMHGQIAVEIAHAAQSSTQRFRIRLEPPELGRVEVRMLVNNDGRVQAHLAVERAETLDFLMRDQRGLERALEAAGVKTENGDLQFSLKRDDGAGWSGGQERATGGDGDARADAPDDGAGDAEPEMIATRYTHPLSTGAVDIKV